MEFAVEIHFVIAFMVALCALAFSWNSLGRRVMNVVLGIQVLIGVAVIACFLWTKTPLPATTWGHVGAALVALLAYGFARRIGDRPGGGAAATALSVLGLLAVAAAMFLGIRIAGLQ